MIRHTDKDIEVWARVYAYTDMSLKSLEKAIKVSHSTLWWCFTHRLMYIDKNLYLMVNTKLLKNNTSLGGDRGEHL